MSLGIHGSTGTPLLHTFITKSPLTLLYFDGQSASLTSTGSLDSQTALLQGEVFENSSDEFVYNERARAIELCAWAKKLKVDGIMRMNAGFEALICDYSQAGMEEMVVSNVTVPGMEARESNPESPPDPTRQPPLGIGNIFAEQYGWEWIRSGTWHYGGSAYTRGGRQEYRVSLDLCGFVTFYDPRLTSLKGKHHGGIRGTDMYENGWGLRRGHRLLDISRSDVDSVGSWIKTSLRRHRFRSHHSVSPKCSGINWQAITETIGDQHRTRAE